MTITAADVSAMVERLGAIAHSDIDWSENVAPPADAEDLALEAIFVICNSGMKNTVARLIYDRVRAAIRDGVPVSDVFRHAGKAAAIEAIWRDRQKHLADFHAAGDKVAWCETLPWIGGITRYHLAKNFGVDVAKPDVHLQRLADREATTAQALCERLAGETGYRVATIDLILWRACATGLLDSRTGQLRHAPLEPVDDDDQGDLQL